MNNKKQMREFERIYKETYRDVLKYILCKCYNVNDVDDIIQDTYLEVFKILQNKKEIFLSYAYIFTIAKNKMIKTYKINENVKTIPIFQEKDNKEYIIDIDARNRCRIEFY